MKHKNTDSTSSEVRGRVNSSNGPKTQSPQYDRALKAKKIAVDSPSGPVDEDDFDPSFHMPPVTVLSQLFKLLLVIKHSKDERNSTSQDEPDGKSQAKTEVKSTPMLNLSQRFPKLSVSILRPKPGNNSINSNTIDKEPVSPWSIKNQGNRTERNEFKSPTLNKYKNIEELCPGALTSRKRESSMAYSHNPNTARKPQYPPSKAVKACGNVFSPTRHCEIPHLQLQKIRPAAQEIIMRKKIHEIRKTS